MKIIENIKLKIGIAIGFILLAISSIIGAIIILIIALYNKTNSVIEIAKLKITNLRTGKKFLLCYYELSIKSIFDISPYTMTPEWCEIIDENKDEYQILAPVDYFKCALHGVTEEEKEIQSISKDSERIVKKIT